VVEQSEGVSAGVYVGDVDVDEGEEDVVNGVGDAGQSERGCSGVVAVR
jgi:hypothetical protein